MPKKPDYMRWRKEAIVKELHEVIKQRDDAVADAIKRANDLLLAKKEIADAKDDAIALVRKHQDADIRLTRAKHRLENQLFFWKVATIGVAALGVLGWLV